MSKGLCLKASYNFVLQINKNVSFSPSRNKATLAGLCHPPNSQQQRGDSLSKEIVNNPQAESHSSDFFVCLFVLGKAVYN